MAKQEDRRRRKRLGELLVEAGLIKAQDLETALARQREFGGRVGSHLLRIGAVQETVLLEFLSRTTGYPAVDLAKLPVDAELQSLIPREVAEKYVVVPIKRSTDPRLRVLTLAMADPTDIDVVDRLQFTSGYRIEPVIATETAVHRFILQLYGVSAVRSSRRDDMLDHIEGVRYGGEATAPSSPIPFVVSGTSLRRRFTALAELLIEKGVITRDELIAKMRKEQSSGKE